MIFNQIDNKNKIDKIKYHQLIIILSSFIFLLKYFKIYSFKKNIKYLNLYFI